MLFIYLIYSKIFKANLVCEKIQTYIKAKKGKEYRSWNREEQTVVLRPLDALPIHHLFTPLKLPKWNFLLPIAQELENEMLPESTRGMMGYSLRKAVKIWALQQKTFKIQKKEEKRKKNVLTVSTKVFRQRSQNHSGLVALESGRAAMTHVCMTTGFHRCCASQTQLLANWIFGSLSFISYLKKNKLC